VSARICLKNHLLFALHLILLREESRLVLSVSVNYHRVCILSSNIPAIVIYIILNLLNRLNPAGKSLIILEPGFIIPP
jgi:hypothetical protein